MAWRDMGGQIDWQAIPILSEVYGIEKIDFFINDLVSIRDHLLDQE
jgi:hypothetical protein